MLVISHITTVILQSRIEIESSIRLEQKINISAHKFCQRTHAVLRLLKYLFVNSKQQIIIQGKKDYVLLTPINWNKHMYLHKTIYTNSIFLISRRVNKRWFLRCSPRVFDILLSQLVESFVLYVHFNSCESTSRSSKIYYLKNINVNLPYRCNFCQHTNKYFNYLLLANVETIFKLYAKYSAFIYVYN